MGATVAPTIGVELGSGLVITVVLKGGLGNQLFQFAAGRHVAFRRGTGLAFDLSRLGTGPPNETARAYALAQYGLDVSLDGARHPSSARQPRTRLGRLLARRDPSRIREVGKAFDPTVLDAPDGTLLDGFWQSERYFASIGPTVRRELALPRPPAGANASLLARIRSSRSSLGVHIRRGDYVTNANARAFHGGPGIAWYCRAVELIGARVAGLELFVFSDDPAWSEANFVPPFPTTFVRHNGDAPHEDLRLMSTCGHHVIANSSFSWWAAWLGERAEQIVVAPSPWFRLAAANTPDLVPQRWITLPIDVSTAQQRP